MQLWTRWCDTYYICALYPAALSYVYQSGSIYLHCFSWRSQIPFKVFSQDFHLNDGLFESKTECTAEEMYHSFVCMSEVHDKIEISTELTANYIGILIQSQRHAFTSNHYYSKSIQHKLTKILTPFRIGPSAFVSHTTL